MLLRVEISTDGVPIIEMLYDANMLQKRHVVCVNINAVIAHPLSMCTCELVRIPGIERVQ
jgi:hypothetical protein